MAARALAELSAIYPLLAAVLAPTAAADDDVPAAVAGLRLVESGLLLTLPGAAAQRPHADTDGSGREEGAPIAYSENNHATYMYIATLPIYNLASRKARRSRRRTIVYLVLFRRTTYFGYTYYGYAC